MKHIFITLLLLTILLDARTQVVRASIGPGSTANSIKIYIRPDISLPNINISTLQFNIGVSSSVTPVATATVRSTTSSFLTPANWIISRGAVPEGGFYNYSIYTAISPIPIVTISNTEMEVMEVAFSGGSVVPQNVALVCLPDGGSSTNGAALFYCTSTLLNSNGSSLYYARTAGVVVNNQFSYSQDGSSSGTGTSTATISGIVLPTKFLSFIANKNDDNAKLTWTVDNEEDNAYFEVEASIDARTFNKIRKVDALRNGRSSNTYNTIDAQISRYSVPTVYYRIKQVEASGRITYTDVRQVNLDSKNFVAALYPNPVKTVTKLMIEAPEAAKATVIIRDAAGKAVKQLSLQLQKGTNQQNLDLASLAAGDYNLTIVSDKLNQTIKMTKSN